MRVGPGASGGARCSGGSGPTGRRGVGGAVGAAVLTDVVTGVADHLCGNGKEISLISLVTAARQVDNSSWGDTWPLYSGWRVLGRAR